MKRGWKKEAAEIRARYPHYTGLSLFEVYRRNIEARLFLSLGRTPTAIEVDEEMEGADGVFHFRGVAYASMTAAANAFSFTDDVVRRRSTINDWTFSEALEDLIANGLVTFRMPKATVVFGIGYETREAACAAYELRRRDVLAFAKRNEIEFEAAFEKIVNEGVSQDRVGKTVKVQGKTFSSEGAAAKAYGFITISVTRYANKNKITFSEALDYFIKNGHANAIKPVKINGKTYPNKTEAAKAFNFNASTVSARATKDKTTFEVALKKLIKNGLGKKRTEVVAFGKTYKSKSEAARAHNLRMDTVWRRAEYNTISFGKALEMMVREGGTDNSHKAKKVKILGKTYDTREKAYRALGVARSSVKYRANEKKISIEEALTQIALEKGNKKVKKK